MSNLMAMNKQKCKMRDRLQQLTKTHLSEMFSNGIEIVRQRF